MANQRRVPSKPDVRLGTALSLSAILLSTFYIHGQTPITLRVLDFRTGKPMPDWAVTLQAGDDPRYRCDLVSRTDKTGTATFACTDGASYDRMRVSEWSHGNCPDRSFSKYDILEQGIVATIGCDQHRAPSLQPRPGELVLYARPLSLWQKMKLSWHSVWPGH